MAKGADVSTIVMRFSRPVIPFAMPLALYGGGAVIAAVVSFDPLAALRWVLVLGVGLASYGMITAFAQTPARLQAIAGAFVIAVTLMAVLTVTQYQYLGWYDEFGPATRIGRLISAPFPLYLDPWLPANASASCFAMALPLAVGLVLEGRGRARWCWGACVVILSLGTLVTASRGAWVALAVVALLGGLIVLTRTSARYARWVLVGMGGFLLLGLCALGVLTVLRPVAIESVLVRALDRATLYRNSLYLTLDLPLTGLGGGPLFAEAYSRLVLLVENTFLTYPHNLLLSVWLWHGLLGLVGFCALLLASGRWIGRALSQLRPVGVGAALGSLANLLHGLTDAPQYDQATVLLVAFALFGIVVAAGSQVDRRPLTWIRSGLRQRVVAGVVATALLVLSGPWIGAGVLTNVATLFHARAVLRADPITAPALLQSADMWAARALQLDPDAPAAHKLRGMTALALGNYADAATALTQAITERPRDQAVRKGLGYAMIWSGQVAAGVEYLQTLDRADEIADELRRWEQVWQDQQRPDLGEYARQAQELLDR
jgi:putative inorganic carbon (hco3(-)) transporter